MTKNQLEYWKLRWNQHYESIYLQIQEKKADEEERANKARELETIRHNKAQEKIATQQNILTKIKLDQDWAKISADIRSMYVHDVVSTSKTLAEIDQYMSKVKTAEIETLLSIAEANDKASIDYAKAAVDAYDKAWKLKTSVGADKLGAKVQFEISAAATSVQELFNNSSRAGLASTKIRENIVKIWPEYVELLGPQAEKYLTGKVSKTLKEIKADYLENAAIKQGYAKPKGGDTSGKSSKSSKVDTSSFKWSKSSDEYINKAREIVGPAYDTARSVVSEVAENGKSTSSGVITISGGSSRKSNSFEPGISSNNTRTTSSGTKVIYSPGSANNRYSGPGVKLQ